jgi:hypothetical protein
MRIDQVCFSFRAGAHSAIGLPTGLGRRPTVNFGPGEQAQSHQPNERVAVRDLVDCTKAVALTISELPNARRQRSHRSKLSRQHAHYARFTTDKGVFEIVYGGATGAMQPFGNRLKKDQILQVMAYFDR